MNREVKRARIRALAAKLIHQPPRIFNLASVCRCAIHVACTMPEFQALGWEVKNGRPSLPGVNWLADDGVMQSIKTAARALGLQQWHVGLGNKRNLYVPTYAQTAFHVGVTYLEYIGDCGPQLPSLPVGDYWGEQRYDDAVFAKSVE